MKPFEPVYQTVYGVLITRKDGSQFLAHGICALPMTYRKIKGARHYRDQLKSHGCNGRVVKIDAVLRPRDSTVRKLKA